MSTTARGLALRALVEVERGARSNAILPPMLAGSRLAARDRGLVTELVYGTCRMQRACDWLADRYVRGRTDPAVRAGIRLGTYQLVWTRIPAHAAVSATVAEVPGRGRSVVNAVLRRVASDCDHGLPQWPDLATELSYPDWIVRRLDADLGPERALEALRTMNQAPSVAVRPDGYAQDRASQMITSHVSALGAGGRVLDMCAAPGGKATGVVGAEMVVASDVSSERTRVVAGNASRLRSRREGSPRLSVMVADGTAPPFRPDSFDLVLVDAPCSGLGVLRRRPDARWRVGRDDVRRLGALQRRLISSAAPLVKEGGILVYSVCTLTRAETEDVDTWASGAIPQFRPVPPPAAPWEPAGRGALLLPQTAGTDGMFLLTLRRSR